MKAIARGILWFEEPAEMLDDSGSFMAYAIRHAMQAVQIFRACMKTSGVSRWINDPFCIEVLEHVHAARAAAACDLARVTRDLLTVTTPNRHFPVIGHDTALPFCHMLPIPLRDRYAARFNRQRRQESNLFWSAHELHVCLSDFERVSRFLNFPNYRAYRRANSAESGQANPLSVPIGVRAKRVFYGVARLAGKYSDFILPNLASTYRRRNVGH
ncbi:MAG TPA: hypothetical protein VIJ16_03895 [Gemmatimonadaceae bacterium]